MTNFQTLKSKKEKVEKGCGECSINPRLIRLRPKADLTKYSCNKNNLCPICQAQLSALNLGIQAVENTIKDVFEIIDNLEGKGETHGFRPKWIDANELKSQLQKEMTK